MLDIDVEVNGETVRPRALGAEVENAMLHCVSESLNRHVAGMRCASHGRRPEVHLLGGDVRHLRFRVTGCCPSFVEEVKRNLSL